jgi:ribose-phosphate pyrophosphokinase
VTLALHAFRDQAAEAQRLADALQVPLAFVDVHTFPDGEIVPRVPAPASTTIVYRSLDRPNVKLVELLLAVDAWRNNGAQRLVLVAPYLPYMRQDTAFRIGEPISQRVIAAMLDAAFDRVITVDPHLHRTDTLVELFPRSECTHLHSADVLVPYLRQLPLAANTMVIGPDVESAPWVRQIAEPLHLDHAVMRKIRHSDTHVEIVAPDQLTLPDQPILLVDDICSTGGTLREATRALKLAGAGRIMVFITHALGSDAAIDGLIAAGVDRVISTDSCTHGTNEIHLANLLARALETES